jgi:hypothetical protein
MRAAGRRLRGLRLRRDLLYWVAFAMRGVCSDGDDDASFDGTGRPVVVFTHIAQ